MNIETKVSVNTVGTFEVKTDGRGNIRADVVSFEETRVGFQVWVGEGVGGAMEPKKLFKIVFSRKTTGHYSVDKLKAELLDYSDGHHFEYIPLTGQVMVWLTKSPRRVRGIFYMDMKNIGESFGPPTLKVTGSFDLSNS
ncbi:hypothetical protein ACS77_28720 [Pseudomonas syringae]|uniref:Uncharacterized protein n=1 Tax=Pseudomonas syringae TaxID=317 RepID=A0A0L1LIL6_PSESX|nr:hypothetical protein ACS77_28720 [Pseudomonas syringae]